jgi:hypothetical protein
MISEMEIEKLNKTMGTVFLDPDQKSPRAQDFEERLTLASSDRSAPCAA